MLRRIPTFLSLLVASGAALAHPVHADGSFAAGVMHPVLDVGHLLAMFAVGFWAARFSGGVRWLLPAVFVGFMALGFFFTLPYVEPVVALSLLVLGLVVVVAMRVDAWIGALLVAVFALYHGQAHFSDVPVGASVAGFAAGVLSATALLHLAGIVVALQLERVSAWLPRAFGAVTLLAGAWFLVA